MALQKADGSWDLTPQLAAILGRSLDELEAPLELPSHSRDDARRAWATALAVAWLHARAGAVVGEWRMLAAKAQKWIHGVSAVPPGGGTWVDAATAFLGNG